MSSLSLYNRGTGEMRMKIGLIGYGAWGSQHASAIVASGQFDIAAVCSQSEPSREAVISCTFLRMRITVTCWRVPISIQSISYSRHISTGW